MKYTKGEWKAQQQKNLASGKYEWVIKVNESEVSDRVIATTPYAKKLNDHEANANLISAAPNMYDACRFALGVLLIDGDKDNAKYWLKKALSKAEGRE